MSDGEPWWRTPSSTRSTSAASPTATATGSVTCRGSAPACRTSRGVDAVWITPFYPLRWLTAATTSPTTATSTRVGHARRDGPLIAEAMGSVCG